MSDDTLHATASPVTPFDTALNVAVHHLATKLFPNGYDVLTSKEDQQVTPQAYMAAHDGRLGVGACIDPNGSLFADAEIEQDLRALFFWGLMQPATEEGHDHPGRACPSQFMGASERIEEQLVQAYGDEPRTREWAKLLTLYIAVVGGLHFMGGDSQGRSPRQIIDAVWPNMSGASSGAIRSAWLGSLYEHLQQAGMAPQVIVVDSPEELEEVVAQLRERQRHNVPTDDTGRQNAPTTGTRQ